MGVADFLSAGIVLSLLDVLFLLSLSVIEPKHQMELKVNLPASLKEKLLEDSHLIQERYLVPLPRSPTAAEIIERTANKTNSPSGTGTATGGGEMDAIGEQLKIWLKVGLDNGMLLYPFEKLQWKQHETDDPSSLYGVEHLLRLIVQLGLPLSPAKGLKFADAMVTRQVVSRLQAIVTLLDEDAQKGSESTFFLASYKMSDSKYQNNAL